MSALRAVLLAALFLVLGILAYEYWTGAPIPRPGLTAPNTTGTSGAIDVERARERGAQFGEDAAKTAQVVREDVAEAAITSKIKAKMALDDHVRARSIDVSTTGTTVTLTGTVRSGEERERAVRLARETNGVSNVIDRLDVQR